MAIQRTFSIIKPDATERNLTGAVNAVIEEAGLRIVAQSGFQTGAFTQETPQNSINKTGRGAVENPRGGDTFCDDCVLWRGQKTQFTQGRAH